MKLTPEKLTAFCAALAETCNVSRAAAAIGVSRYTAYKWRKADADFAAQWDDAMQAALLVLEDEARRRAFDGTDEPLTHQGSFTYLYERDEDGRVIFDETIEPGEDGAPPTTTRHPRLLLDANGQPRVATVKKYSDTLAIFLLKAHAPEKYRENSKIELGGPNDGPIQLESTTRAARLASLVAQISARVSPPDDGSDLA